jgi:hypothetical protein
MTSTTRVGVAPLSVPPRRPTVADLTSKLRRLATAREDGDDLVFVWRQLLTEVWNEGFEAGYLARGQDQFVVELTRSTPAPTTPTETGDTQ